MMGERNGVSKLCYLKILKHARVSTPVILSAPTETEGASGRGRNIFCKAHVNIGEAESL